jgi:hypothetical protein
MAKNKRMTGMKNTASELYPNVKKFGVRVIPTPTEILSDVLKMVCPKITADMLNNFSKTDYESQCRIVLAEMLEYTRNHDELVSMVKRAEKYKPRCYAMHTTDCGLCFYNDRCVCEIQQLVNQGHSKEEAEKIVDDRH